MKINPIEEGWLQLAVFYFVVILDGWFSGT